MLQGIFGALSPFGRGAPGGRLCAVKADGNSPERPFSLCGRPRRASKKRAAPFRPFKRLPDAHRKGGASREGAPPKSVSNLQAPESP